MRNQSIDLRDAVETDRHESQQRVETAFTALSEWTTSVGAGLPLTGSRWTCSGD